VGANVHVYLRNDGASSVTVSDVTLAGYTVATLDTLDDPRVLWATIISTKRFPDGSYSLFGFPELKDGTPVPYPYMTVEDYYYPLEELEEYPLTDPKRRIYNP
jgi:hypothetical protein